MTDLNKTQIFVVLDRSGSMTSLKSGTEEGFNAFIAEQRNQPGECIVTLAQFDTEYDIVYKNKPISDVPPLKLEPRGMTALFDAVGKTIVDAGNELRKLSEDKRPASVIFVILTDGDENSSQEYRDSSVIKAMIEEQTSKYSWLFKFFGADITAITVAKSLGIPMAHAAQYDTANVNQVFATASSNSVNYRNSVAAGQSYAVASAASGISDEEREELVAPKSAKRTVKLP